MTSLAHDRATLARKFLDLHHGARAFVMPNPWDAGSAKLLAKCGFEALATTSAGFANAIGRKDGQISRDEALANAREIIAAVPHLPISADLENGYGPEPATAAETIRLAAEAGLAGGSIEDASGDASAPIYDFNHAVERVAAVVEASRGAAAPFVLCARAENFLHGRPDLDDTIKRLVAFEEAGADVLYAPGLPNLEAIREVCAAVSKPVNVLASAAYNPATVNDLSYAGVRRISLGSHLSRSAFTALMNAAREMARDGTFKFLSSNLSFSEVNEVMV